MDPHNKARVVTPQEFIAKWKPVTLSERSACQQHFLDLCDLLGQPKPAAADPEGAWYTFERGVHKMGGGNGWADVWMKGHFGWEYKGKHKDLAGAYRQLQLYREDLENPPLLVVCDLDRFEIHTNFTGTLKQVHAFTLEGLADPKNLDILRRLFSDPMSLRPGQTAAGITEDAAARFAKIADGMRVRGIPAPEAAHFLMKLMFCMFGDDIGLLPNHVFTKALTGAKNDPDRLRHLLESLFRQMASGGYFGADEIPWFNGGLFADADTCELTREEIAELVRANEHDWSCVEPSIFGTLFERTLDPAKRSQIGAHYTSRQDIETLLEPVVMAPLRREWVEVQAKCDALWEKIAGTGKSRPSRRKTTKAKPSKRRSPRDEFDHTLRSFVERLAHVTILDPACGSGNFLYVAIHLLLNLEKEVIAYGAMHGASMLPQVRPTQLAGIEINPYAHQLAQVAIWIGYLQWMHHNGFNPPRNPVLEPIETIRNMDAILDLSDPENPKEPEWPAADFIVGNPPFLGGNRIRQALGDDVVEALFQLYRDRVPAFADLCAYWVEKGRQMIEHSQCKRAGLLATQAIRGGANRVVLDRVKSSGDIFFAVSDREWILDGAAVHVSMIGFDDGAESLRLLDGCAVPEISPSLAFGVDVTKANRIASLAGLHIEGVKKGADFEVEECDVLPILHGPNPSRRPNSDVLRPYLNGAELYGGGVFGWIVYFPPGTTQVQAAAYEEPFERIKKLVYPKYGGKRKNWWIHERPRPELAALLTGKSRYLATVKHSKHRIFTWVHVVQLVSNAIELFARDDDFFFGVVHSRIHESWSRAPGMGTQLRERESGFRYTPTTCFETFPFPDGDEPSRESIAGASDDLAKLREAWLNPPEWTCEEILEFPGSIDGPWARYVHDPDGRGIGTVRYPRTVSRDADCAAKLKKRTLTNLYNERPTWLDLAHKRLDEAVFAAYGWDPGMSDDELLAKLLALNLERAGAER